jgi:hypothetical protein
MARVADDGALLGLIFLDGDWADQLYVALA